MTIMKFTRLALRNLFSKPATRQYPQVPREYPAATRGRVEISIENCIFCSLCARRCPTGAIAVDRQNKEWKIERFGCIACRACVDNCPKKCLRMENHYTSPSTKKYTDTYLQPAAPQPKEETTHA